MRVVFKDSGGDWLRGTVYGPTMFPVRAASVTGTDFVIGAFSPLISDATTFATTTPTRHTGASSK